MPDKLVELKLTAKQTDEIEAATGARPTELFLETTTHETPLKHLPPGTKVVLNFSGGSGADW